MQTSRCSGSTRELGYEVRYILMNQTTVANPCQAHTPLLWCSPAARLAALQGSLKPKVCGARLLLFAADHGITKTVSGVSAYPRTVTPAMFGAIARGQAASSVLAAANGCRVILTDVGVDEDLSSIKGHLKSTVLHRKVSWGLVSHGVPAGSMCLCLTLLWGATFHLHTTSKHCFATSRGIPTT